MTTTAHETMIQFFTDDEWPFSPIENSTAISTGFHGDVGKWQCFANVREAQRQFIFYSVCPLAAPPEKLAQVTEFITRANYGMIVGNFELDYSDGEVRYKTSIAFGAEPLSATLIKEAVYNNIAIMDEYLPGLLAILMSAVTPAEAIALMEEGEAVKLPDGESLAEGTGS